MTLTFTRYLYNADEVVLTLIECLLKQNSLNECYYWIYEYYKTGYVEESWKLLYKIYYDFYYIKYISFEKVLDIEYNAWKTKPDFKHIAKIIKDLHKQVIDITIFQSYYRNKNKIQTLLITLPLIN